MRPLSRKFIVKKFYVNSFWVEFRLLRFWRYAVGGHNAQHLNNYLNYHRPCGFATVIANDKGKRKKIYDICETPYEWLKSLIGTEECLKPRIDFKKLQRRRLSFGAHLLTEKYPPALFLVKCLKI